MIGFLKQYYPVRNIVFFIFEGCIVFLSILLALYCLTPRQWFFLQPLIYLRVGVVALVCLACLYYNDLYDLNVSSTIPETVFRLLMALGSAAIVLGGIYLVFPRLIIKTVIFSLGTVFLMVFVVAWRVLFLYILKKGLFNEGVIVLGSSSLAMDIVREIEGHIDCGYTVTAVIPDVTDQIFDQYLENQFYFLGADTELCRVVAHMGVGKIVVALKDKRGNFPSEALLKCRLRGIEVLEGVTFFEGLTGQLLVREIRPSWLIFSRGFNRSRRISLFKRFLDVLISGVLMGILLPLELVIFLAVKLDSPGPALLGQERIGQSHRPYTMYKFRSMVTDAEKQTGPVWAGENDMRVTRVGQFIRRYRMDELPQLWNVFKGEMSLVGPRPERAHFVAQLEKEVPYYMARLAVKPGITGWAQILYEYGASVEDAVEKLGYDLFYIKNMGALIDVVIILRTVKTVVFGRGAR